MPSIRKESNVCFFTATNLNWVKLLEEDGHKKIVINSLKYLSDNKRVKVLAFVIMPNKNHKQSRLLFINEAKKLYQKEFIRWFKLTAEINPILKWFRQQELNIPTFYVMGEEDYMFLPSVRKVVESHYKSSTLFVIEKCGHVVNVEQYAIFNQQVIAFIHKS